MRYYLIENNLFKQFEKNFSNNTLNTIHEELEFELKLEDIKIKDYIGKSEILYKQIINKIDNLRKINDDGNINEIVRDYERKIEDLKKIHEKEIKEYKEKFQELKTKYNPDLENDYFNLCRESDEKNFLIEKINEIILPIYEKHYVKNSNWYDKGDIDFKFKELEIINFISVLVNKFFNDNKYLIELVSELQKEKNILIEERNLPYVVNAISKNELLNQILENSKIVEESSEKFHKNFEQIIEYINNIESFN